MDSNDDNSDRKIPSKAHMSANLILSEANKFLRLLQFEKAISWYEMVLQQNANHVQSLLGKAKCYMKLGRYKEAWVDFDKILNTNPKCVEAINLKGISEYLMGHFENCFFTYWQGYQMQPFCDYLRLGYQSCKKTIENSLNTEKCIILTEKDIEKLNNLILENDFDKGASYNKKGLYSDDLAILNNMCKDKNLTGIHSLCVDLFNYLKERQKFWKMQKPHKVMPKSNNKENVKNAYNSVQMNQLLCNFELCRVALNEKRPQICINKCNIILDLLKDIGEDFPNKSEMEAGTLQYLVMAYLIKEKFETAMKYCTQLLCIVDEKNVSKLKCRALRNFGEIYYKFGKHKEALNFFLDSLNFVKSDIERATILYKISDCNVRLNNLVDAKVNVEKCLELVIKHQDLRFQFDALLLLAEIAVKGKEMESAAKYYRNALEIAIRNKDSRKMDLEYLLQIFEGIKIKHSYSKERIKLIEITDNIKHN